MADPRGSAEPAGAQDAHWDWQLGAECRGRQVDLFFHPTGEREPGRSDREQAAKAVCRSCRVRQPCADFALRTREPYGVWGGMTELERQEHIYGVRPTRRR